MPQALGFGLKLKGGLGAGKRLLYRLRRRIARWIVPGAAYLPETVNSVARLQDEFEKLSTVMSRKQKELDGRVSEISREISRTVNQVSRMGRALCETGHFELESATTPGDPTSYGAMSYASREQSLFVYKAAFKRAIDYLVVTDIRGPVVEFGTCTGFTARCIAEILNKHQVDTSIHLFDSFEGLPPVQGTRDEKSYEVEVNRVWLAGAMAVPNDYPSLIRTAVSNFLPANNVHVTKGFFEDTLDANLPSKPCSLIHVDCDLYTSAKYVLFKLAERELYQDGCIVMFDDYNCNRANPAMGERCALSEFLASQSRWTCSPWFSYGWHGQAFFFHDCNRSA